MSLTSPSSSPSAPPSTPLKQHRIYPSSSSLPSPSRFPPSFCSFPSGQIQLILGPMFSGKSTELLRRVRRFQIGRKRCLVIKYSADTRYSADCASTHDRVTERALSVKRLADVAAEALAGVDVIAIDEGQFFADIVEFSEQQANEGRVVAIAALDATFERKPFGPILSLIPLAESVCKLNAVCMMCSAEGSFTKRTSDEKTVEVIGGADKYLATCRRCFFLPNDEERGRTPLKEMRESQMQLKEMMNEKKRKAPEEGQDKEVGNMWKKGPANGKENNGPLLFAAADGDVINCSSCSKEFNKFGWADKAALGSHMRLPAERCDECEERHNNSEDELSTEEGRVLVREYKQQHSTPFSQKKLVE